MTGQGWTNGSDIRSKPTSQAYREGWERIFGKNKPSYSPLLTAEALADFMGKDIKNYKGKNPCQK
jgi:hypothetical protein